MQNRHALAPSLTCGFCSCRVTFATCCAVSGHKPWKTFHEKSDSNYSFFQASTTLERSGLSSTSTSFINNGVFARETRQPRLQESCEPLATRCVSLDFETPNVLFQQKQTQKQLPIALSGCSRTPDKGCFGPHRRSSKLCVCPLTPFKRSAAPRGSSSLEARAISISQTRS